MPHTNPALHLAEARRRSGISLEQIAESTKISTHFLRAIECEEFEKLPGGVFNTSYIRQYASAVGLPASKLLAQYQAYEDAKKAQEQAVPPPPQPLPFRWFNWLRSATPATRS